MTLDQVPYPALVFTTGGRLVEANERALALLGWRQGDAVEQCLTGFVRRKPNDEAGVLTSTLPDGTIDEEEWELQHQDGHWIPVEARATRLSDEQWVVFVHDTRRRKRDEASLMYQADLIRTITDNATTAIFMMSDRSQCTFMNPAAEKMTGYSFDEIRGGILHDFIHHHHPDGRPYPMHDCPIDRALPEEFDVIRHNDVFIRKNGEMFPVEVNAKPIRENGKAVGTVIEVRDVTAEREAMEALASADRDKDQFIATLAHELRNPLAPIRAASAILQSAPIQPEQVTWASEVIQRQTKQMGALLDDLLDVARITSGRLELRLVEVPLTEALQTAAETGQPMFAAKDQRFTMSAPSDLRVRIDPTRVAQAVGNLLVNASKYTAPGGAISLDALADGDCLTISVEDSGVGMAPGDENRLFAMFARSNASIAADGLGIGLALSRRLVELHQGTLEAFSEGLGRGSRFVARFPGSVVGRTAEAEAAVKTGGQEPPRRIVVADDNVDAADSLTMILEAGGHTVKTAYGGRAALAAIMDFRPDVAFLDIGMPDMDGYEVARCVRQGRRGTGPMLVAVTGWGQADDRMRSLEAGFDEHFTKPVALPLVQALLEHVPVHDRP